MSGERRGLGVAGWETGRRGGERVGSLAGRGKKEVEGKVRMEGDEADLVATICPG